MFFAKGEINMNNIYKVIWSKAKNCYVVASEIARSHTKSASGSEKIGGVARHALLALGAACAIACGGFVNVGAAEFVEVQTIGGSNEKVYTKFGTEVYVRDEVEHKIQKELKYYYTATDVDKKFETLATTSDVATNKDNINDLKNKAATTDATLTDFSGRMAAAESDIDGLQADMLTAKSDIGTLKSDMSTAKSDIGTLKTKDTELGQKIDAETANRITSDTALDHKIDAEIANRITSDTALDQKIDKEIQDRENAIKATNDRTGGIARNLEGTQTTIEGIVKVDNQGNVKDVKELSAETITTKEDAVIGGDLKITGETTLNDKLTAKGEATFEKNVIAEKDLTVNGKLNVGEIYLENNKLEAATGKNHDSATAITADGISNLAKVTDKNGNTTESKFTHNEEGSFNYAKEEKITGEWKGSTSNVTADGVSNKMTDSAGNKHTYYQTATESKEQLVNGDKSNFEKKTAEGNTISIKDKDAAGNDKSLTNKQTVDGEKTSVTNKESSSTINQGADQISNHVTSADGKKSSTEVKADGITNTSKDGTITNDAKDIVNNATGNMTNTVGADLTTTVGGNELHEVTGTKTENVTGKVTENYKASQETNVTGDQDIYVTGKQTNKIDGDQENTIGGDQTTTVEGKVTENYGNGQETNVTGDQYIHVTGKQTNKIDGDQENTIDGSQTTTVTGDISNTAENITNEANTKLTDKVGDNTHVLDSEGITDTVPGAGGKGSTFRQRIDAIMGNVKTDAGESEVTQKGDEITSEVGLGEATNSRVTQKKDSLEVVVTDGTNTTSKLQTALDITNTAKDGTITNDAKDIVNNASGNMTNTVGGDLKTTVSGNELHEVTGTKTENVTGKVTENYKAGQETNVTGDQDIYVTGKQTNKIDGDQENTIGGSQTTTVTGDISNKAENITNEANTKLTDKVGDHTRVLDSEGITDTVGGSTFKQRIDKIMMESKDVSIKAEETLTNEAKVITNKVSEDINNEAVNINNTATGIITSKASEIKNQADKLISNKVGENTLEKMEDGKITTSITKGTKANTVISTVDGTSFINSEAAAPVTGVSGAGTAVNTTIKGNTITTGKVTMDYAEVMKDLGVTGKTTTGSLEVKGESKLTGKVTMESDATVGGTLDVTKKATFRDDVDIKKNLSVVGDVTANSYKVGDKTYISAAGINANDQKITNVADGSISEGSKDAVNGGQLYGVKRDLEHQVDKVGANAAAMANLRPMEFDPSSKWNIAAAIGNYGSETAAALGAFYRPNDDVMVNLSTAFGTGENMVGGGVSVRLGKSSNKLSREENNALKAQVDDLTARMDALLSVLNPNMSKDFPDVPENHWAYEAVSRLAGNDIVQGYPDGEFHGERTMTRYEMAEIIYNALSRGAEAEKELVEEFKPELQAMAASEKATAEKAEG